MAVPDTWDITPVISQRERPWLHRLLHEEAYDERRLRPVRIAVFGDSQEADQGGLGYRYMPALNHAAFLTYGNWGETPLGEPVSRSRNPGTITGMRTGRIDGSSAGLAAALKPPCFGNTGWNLLSSNTGVYFALQPDWRGVSPDMQMGYGDYMDRATAAVGADVYGWTQTAAAGEFAWNVRRTNNVDAYEAGAATYTGTTSIGLQDAAAPFVKGQTIGGTWAFSTSQVLQLLLTGNHASNTAALAAVRFRNFTDPTGVVFQAFADGGYDFTSFEASHASMGQFIRATGPYDAVLVNLGANDAYTAGDSIDDIRTNANNFIDFVRGDIFRSSGIPMIFNTDTYRSLGTAGQDTVFNQLPGLFAEIERSRNRVAAINTLRASRRAGFNPTNTLLAGLTNRGAWAASVSYSVDDRVHMTTDMGFTRLFRCIAAHTSAAADAPNRQNNNSIARWVEHRQHALSTVTFDGADDATHHSAFAARLKAQADWQALLMASGRGNKWPLRGRKRRH